MKHSTTWKFSKSFQAVWPVVCQSYLVHFLQIALQGQSAKLIPSFGKRPKMLDPPSSVEWEWWQFQLELTLSSFNRWGCPILLTCFGWCSGSYRMCPTLDVPWMYLGSLQGTFWRSCCITWNIFTNILINNWWLHFDWHKLQKYALIGQWWLVHSVV